MKKLIVLVLIFCAVLRSIAQSVGIGTNTPNASSKLEITSTNSGLLIPRMTTVQRTAISSPATGLLVYDTDSSSFAYYSGSNWIYLKGTGNTANSWSTAGNTNTTSNNFIGTTDNNPVRIKVNNHLAGLIDASSKSIGLGDSAMYNNTGYSNIAIGPGALFNNTGGWRNNLVAIGDSALYNNGVGGAVNEGTFNTAVGSKALYANTTGYNNTATGNQALQFNTTGLNNSAFGNGALHNNTTQHNNSAFGNVALYNNSTGIRNSAFGSGALHDNTTGSDNSALGSGALYENTTGSTNTAMGSAALTSNTTGYDNAALGNVALYNNTTGYLNCATGSYALPFNISGSYNTANGAKSLYSNTTGNNNTANGGFALYSNTTGNNNSANGSSALYSNINGNYNTASGSTALYSNNSGVYNTANGSQSLFSNTFGSYNVAVGYSALENNIDGNYNTAIGYGAGTSSGSYTNTVSIGNSTYLNGFSNQAFFGGTSTLWNGGNVTWSTFSDARVKTDISEDVKGLAFISRLRPVTYFRSVKAMARITGNKEAGDYPGKYDIEKIKFSGFVAQEVEQAANEAGYNFSGITKPKTKNDLYSLSYETFVVPLVKAVQELAQYTREQQKIIEEQGKKIDYLVQQLETIKNRNK